jgi:hypothetical protein
MYLPGNREDLLGRHTELDPLTSVAESLPRSMTESHVRKGETPTLAPVTESNWRQ